MAIRSLCLISVVLVGSAALDPRLNAYGAEVGSYAPKVFPAGLYGELTLDMRLDHPLFRNQKGLLVSCSYRSMDDCVLGVAGPISPRDSVQALNARLVEALIRNDQEKYTEIFKPGDYVFPGHLTPEQAKAGFDMFRTPFSGCLDSVVVGDVICKSNRLFVVQPVEASSKRGSSVVLGYEEYKPNKWRFSRQVVDTESAPEFVTALTGPPLDIAALPADWKKEYIVLSLPEDNIETVPASEILLRVQKANTTVTGKKVESVLEAFFAATRAFPEDNKAPTAALWDSLSATVTPYTLKGLREGYEEGLSQGAPPTHWKNMIVPTLRAWAGRRFVIDCEKMAFLLCIGDMSPSVGCIGFLKGDDNNYRICNINVQADFMGLFYNKEFCATLKEKLLLVP